MTAMIPLTWRRLTALSVLLPAIAVGAEPIQLPPPHTAGGMPLMQALKERHSSRAFSDRTLPPQVLSDLLWAAFGVNRPDSGKRTAPSARNFQETDLYVVLASGAYRYDAAGHRLLPVAAGDLRAATGQQDFVAQAPLNLVYVADYGRMDGASQRDKRLYSAAATGFISQNVYLFCASEGLATVVRGSVDRTALARALKLSDRQHVILAQTVGYPP